MTEDELIATLFAPLAGPGGFGLKDDAAIVPLGNSEELVTTVDAVVAGVHFFPDDPPDAIAAKALGVNLSDLAAKAAAPSGFLLVLALPVFNDAWLRAFADGLGAEALRHGCPLLGGDTVRTPGPLTLSITAFGTVPRGGMLPRTGVRPGDRLYVSGTVGDAALGLTLRDLRRGTLGASLVAQLDAAERAHLDARYLRPQPRLGLRDALRGHAHSGMDVSDGLVGDLRKMLRASGVGGRIDLSRVPLSPACRHAIAADRRAFATAMTGGDDYEVLSSVPAESAAAFERMGADAGIPVTFIGEASRDPDDIYFHDNDGQPVDFGPGAFQHFW